MKLVWDGRVGRLALPQEEVESRHALADAAKAYDWPRMLEVLSRRPDLLNTTRPDGSSLFAPLHQAAHAGAATSLVSRLIQLGAWRTLQNKRGERAVDVAERRGHQHLLAILSPRLLRHVPLGVLLRVQEHFHALIREICSVYKQQHDLRLPELEPLLEFDKAPFWFEVPGMFGGFSYTLGSERSKAKLIVESWCRVVEGSCQRHEGTSAGYKLVEQGFV